MSTAVMNTPMFDCGDHLFKNGMQTKPKDPTPGGGHAPLRRSYTSIVTLIEQHRKLDRTVSEPTSRYKTELCHPFEESGTCKYGDKCQFAHGNSELRNLARHPKYKTELCRTFHTIGFCPYGPRCHFIHNIEEARIHNQKVCAQLHGGQPPNIMGLSPLLNASVAASLNVNLSLLEMVPPMAAAPPTPLLRTNSLSAAQQIYNPPLLRTNSLSLTTQQHNLLLCQNSAVARPKPLNLSPTFSLGSTGDSVSPSSSLSQSPTNSMASFFSDDTTNQPATAFNFGQDFSLLAARQSPSPTDDLAPRTPSPLSPNGESRLPVFNRISSTIGDFENLKI